MKNYSLVLVSSTVLGAQSTTPGSVTSVPGAGGCPSFDFSTCDPDCVVMDAQGCMSCHCAGNGPVLSTTNQHQYDMHAL